jgi:hypothetical protein
MHQAFFRDAGHPDGQTGYRLMGEMAAKLVMDTAAGILGGAPVTVNDRIKAHQPLPAPMIRNNWETILDRHGGWLWKGGWTGF